MQPNSELWNLKSALCMHSCCVNIDVVKITNARVYWYSQRKLNSPVTQNLESELLSRYAYVHTSDDLFCNNLVDAEDLKQANVERYGGYGIGFNSGGVRVGNFEPNVQVKGIGRTLLASDKQDNWHAYGGLRLSESLQEILYSEILNIVLPLGTIDCLALLGIGDQVANPPSHSGSPVLGPAGLLIRERALRPAHFIRSGYNNTFVPQGGKPVDDVERCRRANREFADSIGGVDTFPRVIAQFIERSIFQHVLATMLRFAHGAMASANISIDGRWLDVTVAATFRGGSGVMPTYSRVSTLEEINLLFTTIEEWAHSFSKFNQVRIDNSKIKSLCGIALLKYSISSIRVLIGEQNSKGVSVRIPELDSPCKTLLEGYKNALPARTVLTHEYHTSTEFDDPVVAYVELVCSQCFQILNSEDRVADRIYGSAMLEIVRRSSELNLGLSIDSYALCCVIRALRKAYFTARFSRHVITSTIDIVVSKPQPKNISLLIERTTSAAAWIFDELDNQKVTVFKTQTSHVYLLTQNQEFVFKIGSQFESFPISTLEKILPFLSSLEDDVLKDDGFDFRPGIERIFSILARCQQV